MRILITAGPTREPIDPVRYIANRSSGQMGISLIESAVRRGHNVTVILGPIQLGMRSTIHRIDVESAGQMHDGVLAEFPRHDLLIMAAAVADYRPVLVQSGKLERGGRMTIELEPTPDILAAAGQIKRTDQRTVGFSLVGRDEIGRSREKLRRKNVDLIVHNPLETMSSAMIEPVLLWADGRQESLPCGDKTRFADILLERAVELFA